ncbi:putative ubiquitin-like-specific protease 2A [Cardamine amara subsp. amara]|uniref:Ubiquitin-like-specific protease 2A n=1 Tax=Cardamine amara subsp. amara TaxID=228776 RepID=A0ABD1BB62_CARAN
MTLLPSVKSRRKRKQIGVFDFTDEDDRVEEMSKKLLRKFDSPVTKTSCPIDKYDFLRLFAQDTRSEKKEVDHIVIDDEVSAKEEQSRCELSGHGTGDLINVISDGSHERIGINSLTASSLSENDEASTGEEATTSASDPHDVDSENSQVLITPDVIIYGDIYCTNSKLTFSRNCMNVESSSVNATKETFSSQWTIEDIIKIESQWCLEVETAFVNVLLKSRDPKGVDSENEISGIDLLKFSVYDPRWSKEVETIKLLEPRYKDIWFDTITESEESASSGHNLGTSLTNLADSFEDLVYPQGEPDAVVVRKQDIELLKPRRFINDTIIDFYIKYLKSKIPPEERGRFHFFNCFFFRKLANLDKGSPSTLGGREAYQRVQKWTKNLNLFEKDYIFIPINCSFHWSLIIICHPGELVPSHVENPPRVPCILHLDSIKGSHKGGLINIFPSYLREEWKSRHGNTTIDFSSAPNLQSISLELPQQENSFDCGLFLLHYLDLFVAQAPAEFNPSLITRSENFLTKNWFPAKEASPNSKSKPPDCEVSDKKEQEKGSKNVIEVCNWRKPLDGSSSTVTDIPQTKTSSPDLILRKENFYAGGYDPKSSKRIKVFMSPIVEEVQETHLPMEIEESIGEEIETLYIEDSDEEETVSVEYVSDSQDSYEVEDEAKGEDDDELLIVTGESADIHRSREIKYDSASIGKKVNKSRDLTAASCYDNILLVLSDDERSSDKENSVVTSPKCDGQENFGEKNSLIMDVKPIDLLFFFHKAMKMDPDYLVCGSARLVVDFRFLGEFQQRFHMIKFLYQIHSHAEDEIALEAKGKLKNISHSFSIEHVGFYCKFYRL